MTKELEDNLRERGNEYDQLREKITKKVNDQIEGMPLCVSDIYQSEQSDELKVKLDIVGSEIADSLEDSDDFEGLSISFIGTDQLNIKPEGNGNRG